MEVDLSEMALYYFGEGGEGEEIAGGCGFDAGDEVRVGFCCVG